MILVVNSHFSSSFNFIYNLNKDYQIWQEFFSSKNLSLWHYLILSLKKTKSIKPLTWISATLYISANILCQVFPGWGVFDLKLIIYSPYFNLFLANLEKF